MELWFTEKQTPNIGITLKTKETLHTEKTEFQEMALIDTYQFGRMLVLDGTVQTTVKDEFVYHEMISHIPLFTHPNPEKLLVIGGGDGGTVREALKHESIKRVDLVEIDDKVVKFCREYLPETSCMLGDPRVNVIIDDGIKFVREAKEEYDVIIVDSPDPVGPAEGLFAREFYSNIYGALKKDGLFVAQTESPFFNDDLIKRVFSDVKAIFPITRLYLASIPTYPSGLWSFTMGSKSYDPLKIDEKSIKISDTKYYRPEIHKSVFMLPKFVEDLTK